MNLNLVNDLFNNAKNDQFVKNFMSELSEVLQKPNKNIEQDNLKQENVLYQVVDMDVDGAYLYNTNNNIISKETDISEDFLDKIGNDTVLRYKNGEYIIEEELTQKFMDSLIDVKEYKKIQDKFLKESNILENGENTRYKIEERNSDYFILSFGENNESTIKVPNALIPFWANSKDNLYFKNGKFNRDL